MCLQLIPLFEVKDQSTVVEGALTTVGKHSLMSDVCELVSLIDPHTMYLDSIVSPL